MIGRSASVTVVGREIRAAEDIEGFVREGEGGDEMFEDHERGDRVEEGVVPPPGGGECLDPGREAEVVTEVAEGMGGGGRPGGATEIEGVDPRSERVARKGPQKPFLGPMAVGDDGAVAEESLRLGPEREERGGVGKLPGRDAVDALGRPGDLALGMQERAERFAVSVGGGPQRDPDLDRNVGPSAGSARGFKVDGGEAGLGDGLQAGR